MVCVCVTFMNADGFSFPIEDTDSAAPTMPSAATRSYSM